ncbi:hypothetical protein NQZ68_013454 [Dissostichus eleginoides]|nr:hypothetical protein NQZ68_013454 [Dissostichus eleginoides]
MIGTGYSGETEDSKHYYLTTDSEYAGRVEDHCGKNICTLRIRNLRESDSAEYMFRFETNHEDGRYNGLSGVTLSVPDAPKLPSVSVSPSAEIEEGSSVTLTCSSDANPAANYTWYKKDQNAHLSSVNEGPRLVLSSINSSDSGQCYCTAENKLGRKTSENISIDVKYAPKLPSVSVSPSAEIEEGSSVTLTCSSDANPAANYTWYKKDEDSPKASGQIFTITDFRAEHSGSYSCGAQNKLGRSNSTLPLSVVAGNSTMIVNIIRTTLGVLMLIPVFLLSLWTRKKKALHSTTKAQEPEEIELDSDPEYENDSHTAAQTEDTEEQEDMSQFNSPHLQQGKDKARVQKSYDFLVQGQRGWGLTYTSTEICAAKGSTVEISCSYKYPSPWRGSVNKVQKTFWFTKWRDGVRVDLTTDSEYAGRVEDLCENNICTLRIKNLRESDSAEYKFRFETNQGGKYGGSPGVTLSVSNAPKLPSVSVSPSAEIEEGSSVTLTCSSDANPAANYTWYKKDGSADLSSVNEGPLLLFRSIQSSDSGQYYCRAEDLLGNPPKPPSVSVSPSAEIEEGSSVTLTCSSDANPAANYTWYKENEDSPKASGQIFNITDFRAEHSGSYSCGAQNKLGRSNSTFHQIVVAGSSTMIVNIIRTTLGVLILIPALLLSLWMRKKKALRSTTEAHEPEEIELDSDPVYQNDSHTAAQTEDTEEQEDMV